MPNLLVNQAEATLSKSSKKPGTGAATQTVFYPINKIPLPNSRQKINGQTVFTSLSSTQYVSTKMQLGEGHFCKVTLVKKIGSKEFYALRKIKSQREFDCQNDNIKRKTIIKATKQEILLHQKLQKKINSDVPISKMVDYVATRNGKNEKQFYQFFQLADLGNCDTFYKRIPQDLISEKLNVMYRHIANAIIRGMIELNNHHFYVRDLKLENILVNSDSNVYVSDFGAASYFSKNHSIATSPLTDKRYHPPYKLIIPNATQTEKVSLQDQWALGLTLLEAWNSQPINLVCTTLFILIEQYRSMGNNCPPNKVEDLRNAYKATLKKLDLLPDFLQMPSYLQKIISTLLAVDTNYRKPTLDEIIQPFKKHLTLSLKQMDLVKNNFQSIFQKTLSSSQGPAPASATRYQDNGYTTYGGTTSTEYAQCLA